MATSLTKFDTELLFETIRTNKKGVSKILPPDVVDTSGTPAERLEKKAHEFLTLWRNGDFYAFGNRAIPVLKFYFPTLEKTIQARNDGIDDEIKETGETRRKKIFLGACYDKMEIVAVVEICSKLSGADKGFKEKWLTLFKAVAVSGAKWEQKALEGAKPTSA